MAMDADDATRARVSRMLERSALQARIQELLAKFPEPWVIEKEPHDYKDGTTEFTHVRYRHKPAWAHGEEICVEIGSHVTPDLAELLILLRDWAIETTS